MIIDSKASSYDGERYTVPIWQFNTDTYTVTYTADGKEPTETHFHSECVRCHVDNLLDRYPERLQQLVDSGEILNYLNELDDKVWNAINKQKRLWQETDKEYLLAVADGDILKQAGLDNMFELRAKEVIYPAMVDVL